MQRRLDSAFYVGLLLILGGAAALLATLMPGTRTVELAFAGVCVLGGLLMAGVFVRTHHAWSLPVAAGAIAIGLMTATDALAPGQVGDWAAVMLFTLLGISFLVLAAVPAPRWWPLIPAGVMLTLAGTIAAGGDSAAGGVFLAGLGVTFVAVYLMPPQPVRRLWALITGGVLVLLALPASGLSGQVLGIVLALALIAGGALLLFRGPRTST